ncbi:HAD family hydrolase [Ancylobacter sp.]|uniref:HAD family hydrolase n=1 Tax=Ancylobacter sp. TaxID=1872567 RepID=UPI003BAA18E0
MPFSLFICDCDGVLVDSEVLACRVDAEELARRGFADYTLETVLRRFTGVSQADFMATVEQETGRSLGEDFAEAVASRVKELLRTELQPLPDAGTVLASLPLAKCVASSSAPAKLDLALTVTGLKHQFAPHIFSSVLVEHGKPAPDLFLYAAGALETPAERCCVIEDSVAGVKAARAAGMEVIGFTGGAHCGPNHAERLREHGASTTVERWTDVPAALERLAN